MSCSNHNEGYLYDVTTGRLEAALRGHARQIESMAYRADGKQLATGDFNATIALWDTATGRQFASSRVQSKREGPLNVTYAADGSRLVSWCRENGSGSSRLWDTTTGKQIAVLEEFAEIRRAAAVSPDGKQVAVTFSEFVRLYDAGTGHPIAALGPHEARVSNIVYSPDGKRIASYGFGAASSGIRLWDGVTGKEVALLRGHSLDPANMIFSPDGSRLLSGSRYPENAARLWDAATGRLVAVLAEHKNNITAVAFNRDGTLRGHCIEGPHRAALGRAHGANAGRAGRAYGARGLCRLQPQRRACRDRVRRCHAPTLGRGDRRVDQRAPRTRR